MTDSIKNVNLSNFNNGALEEMFAEELKKVINNIADPNTEAKAIRELNIKIKIKPSESRKAVETYTEVTSKCAGYKGFENTMFIKNNMFFDMNQDQEKIDFDDEYKIKEL